LAKSNTLFVAAADAVDQDQGLVRVRAAQEHRAGLAGAAGARHVHTGLLGKQADQVDLRAFLDVSAIDHRDRCERVVHGLRVAHAGDDNGGLVDGRLIADRLPMRGGQRNKRDDPRREDAATKQNTFS
jgi:hypothetical protein